MSRFMEPVSVEGKTEAAGSVKNNFIHHTKAFELISVRRKS